MTDKCKNCPNRDWCWYEEEEDFCDKGRICPKCGKEMVLCEDERTFHEIWECDGCGYKEVD
jgi:predicted RNA-binding Zn-ribbon protein involved in translation (DUF1610 family)